ncbi:MULTISPECIES: helix-turn-helix domain-containing protein [Acinetobacter]|uniref:Helix-turn-helix domain-containing protein n=1 Tax=Acinetobacter chengduensis TaxID=2420890 RepID=A0ABX9TXI3_9GAMM|nr:MULTISPECIES: helix-turn-helix transcriptional regulator [Acinetobacter]RKG43171.1 XRE family transcriptional regulator [Acinetobacter sp. WCHAc060007]RLL23011.1 helix-turn-helix domain-containing protein [Acinetobacter chengduensis]
MIAKALRLIRQFHELDRTQAAEKLGFTKEFLIAIESGKKPIDQSLLKKYSNTFDIPVSSLSFFIIETNKSNKDKTISAVAKEKMAGKILQILEWSINKNDSKKFQA